MNQKITFVIPSRNNLDLLKLAYKSIRYLKDTHDILILNDASEDGTCEWLESLNDDNLIVYTNSGPDRVGIVGMFDKGIEMARTDIIFAFHADMVAGKNLDVNILKYLDKGKVVCATRVEPPLHPPGPEKIIEDLGIEPEDFSLDRWFSVDDVLLEQKGRTTEGIFAPWCMYKSDYLKVGGHDELFAPQSREDSDLFNRFVLNGYDVIQSWDGLVYHFTSRGSRFNKYAGGDTGKDSPEWQQTNSKNERNFIRKWGSNVSHDKYMKPDIVPRYDIGFLVHNCNTNLLKILEPWCLSFYSDLDKNLVKEYVKEEQPNTLVNLSRKIQGLSYNLLKGVEEKIWKTTNDITIEFDGSRLTNTGFEFLATQLPFALQQDGEVGQLETEIDGCLFKIRIKRLYDYKSTLIDVKETKHNIHGVVKTNTLSRHLDFFNKVGVFIHIPKAAGTSLCDSFFPLILRGGGHSTASLIKSKMDDDLWKGLFKVAWVRNPYARIVSLYKYTKLPELQNSHNLDFKTWLYNPHVTTHCKEFDKEPYYKRNPLSALTYISDEDGNILVDFIGRLEHMNEDLNKLNEQIGTKFPPHHMNDKGLGKDYQKYYDDETREYVSKICEWEIKEFGYKF